MVARAYCHGLTLLVGLGLVSVLTLGSSGCAPWSAWGRSPRGTMSPAQALKCDQLRLQSQQASERGDLVKAQGLCRDWVRECPRSAEAHFRLAQLMMDQRRFSAAIPELQSALELDHGYVDAMVLLGRADFAMGHAKDALHWLESALEIAPHLAEAHAFHAHVLESLGQREEALAAYFRALERDPGLVNVQLRIAVLQRNDGRADQALARLADVLEQSPQNPEAHYQRGLIRLQRKQFELALADLEFATEKLPQRSDVFYHLALALKSADQPQRAALANSRALSLNPQFAEAIQLQEQLRR